MSEEVDSLLKSDLILANSQALGKLPRDIGRLHAIHIRFTNTDANSVKNLPDPCFKTATLLVSRFAVKVVPHPEDFIALKDFPQ